jgi:RNA polymerase sigma-70 factor, ECF subfamily
VFTSSLPKAGPDVTQRDRHLPAAALPLEEASDHTLLDRFRAGSEEAAAAIYHRYAERLRALTRTQYSTDLAGRVDVEDIIQSVFGNFFQGAREGFYSVPDGQALWNLFLVMALNKIRSVGARHRAAKRDVRLTCDGPHFERALETVTVPDGEHLNFLRLSVSEALDRLPPEHKETVQLRMHGYEVAEIARKTSRSKRTVERILQESRQRLAEILAS